MKTNQNMLRRMGEFEVTQRTKDGFFSATKLLNQWNKSHGSNKEIKAYFNNASTKEIIQTIVLEENLHGEDSTYVKSRASRGENSGTWMHPFLFIDFAMWLNPSFKYQVIKFVSDQLIEIFKERELLYFVKCSRDLVCSEAKELIDNIRDIRNIILYMEYDIDGIEEYFKTDRLTSLIHEN